MTNTTTVSSDPIAKVCTICRSAVAISTDLVPSATDTQVICPTHGLTSGIPAERYARTDDSTVFANRFELGARQRLAIAAELRSQGIDPLAVIAATEDVDYIALAGESIQVVGIADLADYFGVPEATLLGDLHDRLRDGHRDGSIILYRHEADGSTVYALVTDFPRTLEQAQ